MARDTAEAERSDELSASRREVGTLRQREATLASAVAAAQKELADERATAARLNAELSAERQRAERLAADLAAADGRVRDALIDLAARVVASDESPSAALLESTELPEGAIAATATALVGDSKTRASTSDPDAVDLDLVAELDAAAEAEVSATVPVRDEVDERPKGDAPERPTPANDTGTREAEPAIPAKAHEERYPSRP